MSHGILNSLDLFLRTSRLLAAGRCRFIIVLPLNDPILLLHLRDVQIRHAVSVFFFDPIPDRIIGRTLLKSVGIHILQTEFNPQFLQLDISLGKQTHRLVSYSHSIIPSEQSPFFFSSHIEGLPLS